MTPEKIINIAKENGFESVVLSKTYNGMNVYEAYNESEEVQFTGYPIFIIDDKEPRLATPEETMDIMGIKPINPNNYTGELL